MSFSMKSRVTNYLTSLCLMAMVRTVHSRVSTVNLEGMMLKSEIPDTGEEWVSLAPDAEFQMSGDFHTPEEKAKASRTLHRMLNNDDGVAEETTYYNPYQDSALFMEGENTAYSGYSQAWRYLGFYIDCNSDIVEFDDDGYRRRLSGDDYEGCTRYLMWAAYIDPYYEGGGLAEYQFYNRWNDTWTSYCDDEDVCRYMDCHLDDTHFKLLGFFKHYDYDDWMEQLFKHEGICIWTEDEYEFMQDAREELPQGCGETEYYDEDENPFYVGLLPQGGGDIGVEIFVDELCMQPYSGEMNTTEIIESMVGNDSGDDDGMDVGDFFEAFNSAHSIFKICQPCIAYSLENMYDDDGWEQFDCNDDAGYTNVNQCMKFSTHAVILPAKISDVVMANQQGTINNLNINVLTSSISGYSDTAPVPLTWTDPNPAEEEPMDTSSKILAFSMTLFGIGLIGAFVTTKGYKSSDSPFSKSLVRNEHGDLTHNEGILT
mmetsp:Transcript_29422/g.33848  ORF Transcript_29422/g.33848 Transcript_29422/m.33848 type:complete len:486 (+) Transcript_29422:98-1555(+)